MAFFLLCDPGELCGFARNFPARIPSRRGGGHKARKGEEDNPTRRCTVVRENSASVNKAGYFTDRPYLLKNFQKKFTYNIPLKKAVLCLSLNPVPI